jgi:hypothetical protein
VPPRFTGRVSLIPDLRINFSKSGASLSIGHRGAWYTVGRRGQRVSLGAPGTGIWWTKLVPPRARPYARPELVALRRDRPGPGGQLARVWALRARPNYTPGVDEPASPASGSRRGSSRQEHYPPFACLLCDSVGPRPGAEKIKMLTSALWVGGEIFLGVSLTMVVGTLIAIFGDQMRIGSHRHSGHVAAPGSLPNAGAFRLPTLDPPQLGHSRIAERALAPRFGFARVDSVSRKGLARPVIGRKAA